MTKLRNIVLTLVAANLLFAVWRIWYAAEPAAAPLEEREFGEIVLASEFVAANPDIELAEAPAALAEAAADDIAAVAAGEPVADLDAGAEVTEEGDAADPDAPTADADDDPGLDTGGEALTAEAVPPADGVADDDADDAATDAADVATADTTDDDVVDLELAAATADDVADPALAAASDDDSPGAALTAAADDPEDTVPADPEGDLACLSVGPFRELSQVTSAAANLREDGLEPRQRAGQGQIWTGYWVYLEQLESLAAAREMRDVLHEDGLSDAYIIPDSDSGILISLGIFSEIIRASRVSERAHELGFEATIADRVRDANVYWIDVNVAEGTRLDFERLQPQGRIIRLEQRACSEVEL